MRAAPVVTASVDQMTFLHPVHLGELVRLKSQVNRVFRTSMEVGVKVWVENLRTTRVKAHVFRLSDVRGIGPAAIASSCRRSLPETRMKNAARRRRLNAAPTGWLPRRKSKRNGHLRRSTCYSGRPCTCT